MDAIAPLVAILPPELLCLVVQALDPISLICLSQTNRFFRCFISPQRIHFVQRLLALELLPEHGSIVPFFDARLNAFRPPPHDALWDLNKYACSGCLKLLTHKMFDNHSVYSLTLRKPPPGSDEATKLTDWEPPGDQVGRWKRKQRRQGHEQERLKEFRIQYATATKSLGRPVNGPQPPNGFLRTGSDDAEDGRLAREAESVLCGRSRHRRLCLECKRTKGMFARRTRSNTGSPEAPMVVTRQVRIGDSLSLCFPPSIHGVPEPPLPRILRVNHPDRNTYLRTPMVMFCLQCSTWQDMWAFGSNVIHLTEEEGPEILWNRDPDYPVKSQYKARICHHCIASTMGIDRLGDLLLALFLQLAERSALKVRGRLNLGWGQFFNEFYGGPPLPPTLDKPMYKTAGRRIFGLDEGDRQARSNRFHDHCVTAHGPMQEESDPNYLASSAVKDAVSDLSQSITALRIFLYTEASVSDLRQATESWQGIWLEDYEDNEQALFYLYYLMASVRNDPQRLVDYALHPDRFRYPRPPLTSIQKVILEREEQEGAERPRWEQKGRLSRRKPSKIDMENEMTWKDMYLAARDRAPAGKEHLDKLRAFRG